MHELNGSSVVVTHCSTIATLQLQHSSLTHCSPCVMLLPIVAPNPLYLLAADMLLDDKAILTLDLLAPSSSGGTASSAAPPSSARPSGSSGNAETLLQLLDRAASPAGRRLLRNWICRWAAAAAAADLA
jgi:hypothetical protein